MLRVKTEVRNSEIHGLGLFAAEFIKAGTVTWQYDPDLDTQFTREEIDSLPEIEKEYLLHFCYYDHDLGKFVLCADNQRFINHSFDNTNISSTPQKDVAKRDIKKGEELLCNYNEFDDEYFERIGIDVNKLK